MYATATNLLIDLPLEKENRENLQAKIALLEKRLANQGKKKAKAAASGALPISTSGLYINLTIFSAAPPPKDDGPESEERSDDDVAAISFPSAVQSFSA